MMKTEPTAKRNLDAAFEAYCSKFELDYASLTLSYLPDVRMYIVYGYWLGEQPRPLTDPLDVAALTAKLLRAINRGEALTAY